MLLGSLYFLPPPSSTRSVPAQRPSSRFHHLHTLFVCLQAHHYWVLFPLSQFGVAYDLIVFSLTTTSLTSWYICHNSGAGSVNHTTPSKPHVTEPCASIETPKQTQKRLCSDAHSGCVPQRAALVAQR